MARTVCLPFWVRVFADKGTFVPKIKTSDVRPIGTKSANITVGYRFNAIIGVSLVLVGARGDIFNLDTTGGFVSRDEITNLPGAKTVELS